MIRAATVWQAFCDGRDGCNAVVSGPTPESPDADGSLPGLYDKMGAEGWTISQTGDDALCAACSLFAATIPDFTAAPDTTPPSEGRVPVNLFDPAPRRQRRRLLQWIGRR